MFVSNPTWTEHARVHLDQDELDSHTHTRATLLTSSGSP